MTLEKYGTKTLIMGCRHLTWRPKTRSFLALQLSMIWSPQKLMKSALCHRQKTRQKARATMRLQNETERKQSKCYVPH